MQAGSYSRISIVYRGAYCADVRVICHSSTVYRGMLLTHRSQLLHFAYLSTWVHMSSPMAHGPDILRDQCAHARGTSPPSWYVQRNVIIMDLPKPMRRGSLHWYPMVCLHEYRMCIWPWTDHNCFLGLILGEFYCRVLL